MTTVSQETAQQDNSVAEQELPVALRRTKSAIASNDAERLGMFEMTRQGYLTDRGGTVEELGANLAERRADFMANAAWITGAADDVYRRFTNEMREAEPEIIKMLRMAQQALKTPRLNREKLPEMLDTCEKVLHVYDKSAVTIDGKVESVRISGPCGSCGRPSAGAIHAYVSIEPTGGGNRSVQGVRPACDECVAAGRCPDNAVLTANSPGG